MNDADSIREFFDDAENAEKLHGFVLPMSAPRAALDRFEAELNEAHGRGNTWYDHFENVNSQLKIKQVECDDITDRAMAAEAKVQQLKAALDHMCRAALAEAQQLKAALYQAGRGDLAETA